MKLMASLVICKGFALCRGFITPGDTYNYDASETNVDTRFSQIFYMIDGGGVMNCDGKVIGSNINGTQYVDPEWQAAYNDKVQMTSSSMLVDLRDFYGKSYNFTAGDKGAGWLCINPIPSANFFTPKLLTAGINLSITGDGNEHIIMCAKGTVVVNDKILNQFNYTRVLNGKTASIVVPGDSEAIYMTR
jgi:hypothetical protein